MTQKLGCLIVDLEGTQLSQEEREMLAHPLVGGVILFSRNYESRQQLIQLCREIRAARKTPFLIMVDQEGGRVQRFICDFTRLPPMGEIGRAYDANPDGGCQKAHEVGRLMASELLSVGVDMSLAPVLDVNRNLNTVIGDRAFHATHEAVTALATAFMQGMRDAGMAATGKHFPGHGGVTVDSHVGMPIDERSFDVIEQADLVPFAKLIQAGMTAVMAAHIVFPQVDQQPVGYSRIWLHDILRKQLHFSGVIVSDDLNMEGANISSNYADRAVAAIDAGCDLILLCNNRKGVITVLDQLPPKSHYLIDAASLRTLQGNLWKS